ncbi:MAG: PD-(D/E)XK nuclease family protein [Vibrio cyclitrophicus]
MLTMQDYLENKPDYNPVGIELAEVFTFKDFDNEEMPLYLDTRIDLIHEDENGDLHIVDHKTTTKGYEKEPGVKSHKADLQAGAYFLGCMAMFGKAPKTCTYDQVLK